MRNAATANTLGLYHFGDISGSTIPDSGPDGVDGETFNSPSTDDDLLELQETGVGFPDGASLVLNGTDEYALFDGLLDACPPCLSVMFMFEPTGSLPDGGVFWSKAWEANRSIKLMKFASWLLYQDEVLGNTVSSDVAWNVGTKYVIALSQTPTGLKVWRGDTDTGVVTMVTNTSAYAQAYTPPPSATSRRYATYPGGAVQPFSLGCDYTDGTAASFCPGKYSELVIENRPWTTSEIKHRMLQLTNYIPDNEQARWTMHPTPVFTPPGGAWWVMAGEISPKGWEQARERVWATFTGQTGMGSVAVGIGYSDDYGLTWTFPINCACGGTRRRRRGRQLCPPVHAVGTGGRRRLPAGVLQQAGRQDLHGPLRAAVLAVLG